MSLRLRLLLTLAPLFILGLAAADVGTYAALQSSLLQGVDNQLVAINLGVMNVLQHPAIIRDRRVGRWIRSGVRVSGGNVRRDSSTPSGTVLAGGSLFGRYVDSTSSSHPIFPSSINADTGQTLTIPGTGSFGSHTAYTSRR